MQEEQLSSKMEQELKFHAIMKNGSEKIKPKHGYVT